MTAYISQAGRTLKNIGENITHKNACKIVKYGIKWGQIVSEGIRLDPQINAALKAVSISIATCNVFEAVSNIGNIGAHTWSFILAPSMEPIGDLIAESSELISSLPDISSWCELSGAFPEFMSLLHPLAGVALLCVGIFSLSKSTLDYSQKLSETRGMHNGVPCSPLERHRFSLNKKLTLEQLEKGGISLETARTHLYLKIAQNICGIAAVSLLLSAALQIYTFHSAITLGTKTAALAASIAAAYFASSTTEGEDVEILYR